MDSVKLTLEDVESIEENAVFYSSISISDMTLGELPEGIKIHGNLCLSRVTILRFPEKIRVEGDLDLASSTIKSPLSKGVVVQGDIRVKGSEYFELSPDFCVLCDLILEEVTACKFSSGLSVKGTLDMNHLRGSLVLPDNLTVGGSLDVRGSTICSLPRNLTVGHSLAIIDTCIATLPSNLKIGGSLFAGNSALVSLPFDLVVGVTYSLENTKITHLPANMTVQGDLILCNTPLKSLPLNLRVEGCLSAGGTQICSVPSCLSVGEDISLQNTNLLGWNPAVVVRGNLYLGKTNITEVPEGTMVGRDLFLPKGDLMRLPKKMYVGGLVHIQSTVVMFLSSALVLGGGLTLWHSRDAADTLYISSLEGTAETDSSKALVQEDIPLKEVLLPEAKCVVGDSLYMGDVRAVCLSSDITIIGGKVDISPKVIIYRKHGNDSPPIHTIKPKMGDLVGHDYIYEDGLIKELPEDEKSSM